MSQLLARWLTVLLGELVLLLLRSCLVAAVTLQQ